MTTESAAQPGPAQAVSAEVVLADIQSTALSVDELLNAVRHPSAGAVVVFVGYVRNRDHGESVEVLDYTCHPSARQVAQELADRLAADGRTIRLGVVHRVGHLAVGDVAVVAAVSAVHRQEAFEVCAALIDDFKRTVPIWKHQLFTDGSDEWVGLP
jgi:molybdopterin synthase catalytic subunit